MDRDPARAAEFAGDRLFLDEDEWSGQRYVRDQAVLHIELRRWAEILVIAPLGRPGRYSFFHTTLLLRLSIAAITP